jgi:hypothetical protein
LPHVVAEIFHQAAALNRDDPRRRGNTLMLEAGCQVLVAGDIHGHRGNLNKLIEHAGLARRPAVRLVLQEIVHGPPEAATGHDRSIELLLRAARLKVAHPQQALFVLGNHDLAEVTGNEITKDGRGTCKAFAAGVAYCFAEAAGEIMPAVKEFLLSAPIAIKCPNKVLVAHSAPSPDRMEKAGVDVLGRPSEPADLRRGGGAYEWTWGRGHTPQQLRELAAQLDVSLFVLGHMHVPHGCEAVGDVALVLASDTDHGCMVEFDGDQVPSFEQLRGGVRKIASLGK